MGDWLDHAACRDTPTSLFYPESGGGTGHDVDYGPAKAICAGCVVVSACLEANIDDPHGCFGGTTPRERWHLLKARPKAARCGGCAKPLPAGYRTWCSDAGCRQEMSRRKSEASRRRRGWVA